MTGFSNKHQSPYSKLYVVDPKFNHFVTPLRHIKEVHDQVLAEILQIPYVDNEPVVFKIDTPNLAVKKKFMASKVFDRNAELTCQNVYSAFNVVLEHAGYDWRLNQFEVRTSTHAVSMRCGEAELVNTTRNVVLCYVFGPTGLADI